MSTPSLSRAKLETTAADTSSARLRTAPMPDYTWITPWSGIALIVLFGALLAIPFLGFFIHFRQPVLQENRTLAPLPDFRRQRLQDLPPKLDAYFKDHVGFRASMVRASGSVLHGLLQSPSDRVILGKAPAPGQPQWLFLALSEILEDGSGQESISRQRLERWRRIIEQRTAWLAARGIAYFYVVAPEKSTIYPELLPDYISQRSPRATALDEIVAYLKETRSSIRLVDLRHALFAAKSRGDAYFPGDTHWNGRGFFAGYQEMFKAIWPGEQPLELGPYFEIRISPNQSLHDLANILGLPAPSGSSVFLAHRGSATSIPATAALPADVDAFASNSPTFALATPGADSKRLLVFHDSFFDVGPMTKVDQPLAAHFSRSYFVFMDPDDDTIRSFVDAEHPDVVLEEHVERSLADVQVETPLEPVTPRLARSSDLPSYYLDSIGGSFVAPGVAVIQAPRVILSGWAIDRRAGAPASGVEVVIDGQTPVPAAYGYGRGDVAAFYQRPSYLNCGFRARIPSSILSIGPHTLTIRVIAADGTRYSESTYGQIVVRP
jgi:hypothetical protein